jgi:hypothetical protein
MKKEYLVKWKGYGPDDNSWEPAATIEATCQDALQTFRRSCGDARVLELDSDYQTDSKTEHDLTPGALPTFESVCAPTFTWGSIDSRQIVDDIQWAYETTSKWRRNVFQLPSNRCGKFFTRELARLYGAYAERSPLEAVAFKAAAIFAPLMLQTPVRKSLSRRLPRQLPRTGARRTCQDRLR